MRHWTVGITNPSGSEYGCTCATFERACEVADDAVNNRGAASAYVYEWESEFEMASDDPVHGVCSNREGVLWA